MADEEVVGSIATGEPTPSPEEGRTTEDAGGVQTAPPEEPTYDLEDEASIEKLLDEHPKVKAAHGRRLKSEHDGVENKWKPQVATARAEADELRTFLRSEARAQDYLALNSGEYLDALEDLVEQHGSGREFRKATRELVEQKLVKALHASVYRGAQGAAQLAAAQDAQKYWDEGADRVHPMSEAEKEAAKDKYQGDYAEHRTRAAYNKGRRDGREELEAEQKAKGEKANSDAIKKQGTPTAGNGAGPSGRRPTPAQYASVSMEQREKWRREGIEPLV